MKKRRKGSGTIEGTRDGRFRVRVTTDVGRRSLGVYDTREEAEAVLENAIQRLAGEVLSPGVTLAEYGKRFLDRRELEGVRGIKTERNRWAMHIASAAFADAPIAKIVRGEILAWLDVMCSKRAADRRRRRQLSRPTIQNTINLLRACFDMALERGVIAQNPARDVRVPKRVSVTREPWTYLLLEEQRRLTTCPQIPAEARALMAFAIGTGLRQGEQWCLEMADVHAQGPSPHVVVRFGSPGKPPKNGKIRRVPLFGLALEAARWRLANKPKKNELGLMWPNIRNGRRSKGEPSPFQPWLALAGIVAPKRHDGRPVRWHDLRHTCASSLVAGWWGEPSSLEEVKALLGHSSVTITERYAHLAASQIRIANKPADKPADISGIARKLLSHLRDLNSRPTVYESDLFVSDSGAIDPTVARARAQLALEQIARGESPYAAVAMLGEILTACRCDHSE